MTPALPAHRVATSVVEVRAGDRPLADAEVRVEQLRHADAGLSGHVQYLRRIAAEQLHQLLRAARNVGVRQVDLVEHRDDGEVLAHRQIQVADGLRLNPLRRIDEQHRALHGRERARHLVREVHVSRRVDEVQGVGSRGDMGRMWLIGRMGIFLMRRMRPLFLMRPKRILHARGRELDGNPLLALQLHGVEHLLLHLALLHRPRDLQKPVRERGLPVVDMRDDAEIPDVLLVGHNEGILTERGRFVHPRFPSSSVRRG